MGAGHSHSHSHAGHGHSHGGDSGALNRLGLAFVLNLVFAIIEMIGGFYINSVAVMSDGLHDFGDAFAIGLAYILEKVSHRQSNARYSYGYRRYSTASAAITGVVLVAGSIYILVRAIPRLFHPEAPNAEGMIAFAVLGIAVNGFAMWKVSRGTSLSERMIVWHLLEDLMGWVCVLIGGILIRQFGWLEVDAILACGLSVWIVFNVIRNLREVLTVFLQVVPGGVSLASLEAKIATVNGVCAVHHSHLWSLDGENHIFTAHLVVDPKLTIAQIELVKRQVKDLLKNEHIVEATLEVEPEGADCFDPKHGS